MLSAQPTTARLEDWGAPKDAVARSALTNLLQVRRACAGCAGVLLCRTGCMHLLHSFGGAPNTVLRCLVLRPRRRATATWRLYSWTRPTHQTSKSRQATSRQGGGVAQHVQRHGSSACGLVACSAADATINASSATPRHPHLPNNVHCVPPPLLLDWQVLTEVYATRSLPLSEPVVVGLVSGRGADGHRMASVVLVGWRQWRWGHVRLRQRGAEEGGDPSSDPLPPLFQTNRRCTWRWTPPPVSTNKLS